MGHAARREEGTSKTQAATAPNATALARLLAFMKERRESGTVPKDFGAFERDLHARMMELERELLHEELVRADVDVEAIEVEGVVYRRVVRCEDTYFTAAGPVRVERTLYKDRTDAEARSICPMELRLGIIAARWTQQAAELATWVVAQMTPALAEELLARVGNMTPSKSTLDRLPKQIHEVWEGDRTALEASLRDADAIPEDTAVVAVSLDGVMAPMKDGQGPAKRAAAMAEGQVPRGPAGYREVGCGTISMYRKDGELLRVIRMARMPEAKKASLKDMLSAELTRVLAHRPDVTLVKVADGARDNWDFLATALPDGEEVLDFFHAAEHLADALNAVYGDGTIKARNHFDTKRRVLLEDHEGAQKVLDSLTYLARKHASNQRLQAAVTYFRENRARMPYARMTARGLPIGSGVVEAACKTLVAQRLKLSGMRWGVDGGQAILNLRSWHQSNRFDEAWALIAARYKADITVLANVTPLPLKAK